MGIFTRFRDIVSANINAMLDRAEDPEKLIKLMIREMEDTLVELKASCAGGMAARKKVERELEQRLARRPEDIRMQIGLLMRLAHTRDQQGDVGGSLLPLKKAAELAPDDYKLRELYEKQKMKEERDNPKS